MALNQALLPEFDQEMANLRKTLERIPEDKLDWTPHEKSMSFRGLASHVTFLPHWAKMTLETESFDFAPDGEPIREEPVETLAQALERLDENVAAARAAIESTDDEAMMQPWTLLSDGKEFFKMPRIAVLRGMILNHLIHHRGQLTVYLRLNDIPLPAIYGPSADEQS